MSTTPERIDKITERITATMQIEPPANVIDMRGFLPWLGFQPRQQAHADRLFGPENIMGIERWKRRKAKAEREAQQQSG